MDYNININKICRVCLEEGVLTSVFNTEFAMMPAEMLMLCARIKVYKNDGLPPVICNNCIYRLGAAYHFKQQCENSDLRLRSYLGILEKGFGTRDNETNTDPPMLAHQQAKLDHHHPHHDEEDDDIDDDEDLKKPILKSKTRNRYKRKLPEERKKRGPKPQQKVAQTCYECNKTFKCAAQLHLHIRTHTGERPFVCSFCSRRFAQKHNLAIHVRTHTGERPFQCEICSKQFAALGNFQAHKKIHAGIRDHLCPVCTKAFITSGDLARHMITHTGIKNHHCDVCGKTFSRNRDMVAHKKKLHLSGSGGDRQHQLSDTTTYKCRECQKVFATAGSLAAHHSSTHEMSTMGLLAAVPSSSATTSVMPLLAAPTAISAGAAGLGGLGGIVGGLSGPPPGVVGHGMLGHHHHHHVGQSSLGMMHHHHHHHAAAAAVHHHHQRLHPF